MSSMVNHFGAPRQDADVCKEFAWVRPPADADCLSEDLEMGSMTLQASDSASSLPLLMGSMTLRASDSTSSLRSVDEESSYAGSLGDSSHVLGQEQEVRKLRRMLLDNLKTRQQQCLRTMTPLKQIENITCMPRSMSEKALGWQERALCISDGLQDSARTNHLMEQLFSANLARNEALEEARQLRKELVAIQKHQARTTRSKSRPEKVPLRRFSMLTTMMVLMLAGPLPFGLKRWNSLPGSQACKSLTEHTHQLQWR